MQTFLVTCNPGLEDFVKAEIKALNPVANTYKFFEHQGNVAIENASLHELFQMRSIDQIVEIKNTFRFDKTLDGLLAHARATAIEELDTANSFRVSTRRYGNHPFSSHEVQTVVGGIFQEAYNQTVSLKDYDLHIRLDVVGRFAYIGIEHTPEKYQKRFEMDFLHRAGIKSSVAYALMQIADIQKGQTILDPFCGAGTIPMEIAYHHQNRVKIIGGDLYEDVIEGGQNNARQNQLDQAIDYRIMNVFQLPDYIEEPVDAIISNPPYGVKSATKSNMRNLFRAFINHAARILREDGKLVILMQRADMFRQTVLRTKLFKITEERVVESGSLHPHLFVLGKIDEPED